MTLLALTLLFLFLLGSQSSHFDLSKKLGGFSAIALDMSEPLLFSGIFDQVLVDRGLYHILGKNHEGLGRVPV